MSGKEDVLNNLNSHGDGIAWVRSSMIGRRSFGRVYLGVLHDSALSSHCSACFSALSRHPLSLSAIIPAMSQLFSIVSSAAPPLILPSISPPVNTPLSSDWLTFSRTFFKNAPFALIRSKNESICQDGESQILATRCSPNSCYRFLVGPTNDERLPLKIAPAEGSCSGRNGEGLMMGGGLTNEGHMQFWVAARTRLLLSRTKKEEEEESGRGKGSARSNQGRRFRS